MTKHKACAKPMCPNTFTGPGQYCDEHKLRRDDSYRPSATERGYNAQWFKDNHNGELFQVEVDALDADILRGYVRDAVEGYLDKDAYNEVLEAEMDDKQELQERTI